MLDFDKKRKLAGLLSSLGDDKTILDVLTEEIKNLRDSIPEEKDISPISKDVDDVKGRVAGLSSAVSSLVDEIGKSRIYLDDKLSDTSLAEKVDALPKIIESLKNDIDSIKKLKPQGGGNTHRKITNAGTDIGTRYADINLIGSGITIAAVNNNITKKVDLTLTGSSITLPITIPNGGTNATSFTTNDFIYYDGTRFVSSPNLVNSSGNIIIGGIGDQGDGAAIQVGASGNSDWYPNGWGSSVFQQQMNFGDFWHNITNRYGGGLTYSTFPGSSDAIHFAQDTNNVAGEQAEGMQIIPEDIYPNTSDTTPVHMQTIFGNDLINNPHSPDGTTAVQIFDGLTVTTLVFNLDASGNLSTSGDIDTINGNIQTLGVGSINSNLFLVGGFPLTVSGGHLQFTGNTGVAEAVYADNGGGVAICSQSNASAVGNLSNAYTTPANFNFYELGGTVVITAVTGKTINLQVTYTDAISSAVITKTFIEMGQTSGTLSTTGSYTFPTITAYVKGGTTITFKTTQIVAGTSITFSAYGMIYKKY